MPIPESRKTENGKGVCTRTAARVHTVGWVSSDTMLQVVHTPNRWCAHGQMRMWLSTGEMYNYTIRLHKYAKLTVRESRIWAQLFFWMKICENLEININYWKWVLRRINNKPWMRLVHPWLDSRGGYFFPVSLHSEWRNVYKSFTFTALPLYFTVFTSRWWLPAEVVMMCNVRSLTASG